MRVRAWIGVWVVSAATAMGAWAQAQEIQPADPGVMRIGLLGGLRQFNPTPALFRYVEAMPELCIWLGDNVYVDTQEDVEEFHRCYAALATRPEFQRLREASPFAVVWDDHDYGDNNDNKTYPLKEESKSIFREFWRLEDKIPPRRGGVYYADAFEFGEHTLRVILLDVRYHRDEPGTNGDILGEAQWEWLAKELTKPADLTLVVSGTQYLLDRESGSETWENYPRAQVRLMDTVRNAAAENILFLAGDQHYAEVSRKGGVLDFDFIEFEFCGINQIEDPEFNTYRVSTVAETVHSCVFMDIQWDATTHDCPHILFRVLNALTLAPEVLYRVNFSELRLDLELEGPFNFVDAAEIRLRHGHPGLTPRYTLDGTEPTADSPMYAGPIRVDAATTVKCALFSPQGWRRSQVREAAYGKVAPIAAVAPRLTKQGLIVHRYEGRFKWLPPFENLEPLDRIIAKKLDAEDLGPGEDYFALELEGYLDVPQSGMYRIVLTSDDGSRLFLHGQRLIDNDGSHSARPKDGYIALEKGLHPLRIEYFEDYMGQELTLEWFGPSVSGEVHPKALRYTE